MCHAVRWLADGNAFWAILEFAGFVWTFDLFKRKGKTSHSGFSHFTSHTAFLGSWQAVWHTGGSHTGSQMAGNYFISLPSHLGSSHFHAHCG